MVRRRGTAVSEETLGFVVVGAAGLGLLALAVLVVGTVSAAPGRAEGLGLLGLGAFVVYLLAAWVLTRWLERRDRDRAPHTSFPPPTGAPDASGPSSRADPLGQPASTDPAGPTDRASPPDRTSPVTP